MEIGEAEARSITLPEHLECRIFALVPFPYIFKLRLLSKSWLARFQPVSSSQHEEAEEKFLITLFQKQVVEWSYKNWKTFGPIFFREDDFVAYDRASERWQQMPWLSLLPEKPFRKISWWRLEGALLLFELEEMDDGIQKKFSLQVSNILSGCWRKLPPRFLANDTISSSWPCSWLILMSSQTYKVVIFDDYMASTSRDSFADVYDSKSGAWKHVVYEPDLLDPPPRPYWWKSNWAHLNGFLYRLIRQAGAQMPKVESFNVKEEIYDSLEMPVSDVFKDSDDVGLMVCNGCLLALEYFDESVTVKKIHLGSPRFEVVTHGPPASLNFGMLHKHSASDGACLFFVKARSFLKFSLTQALFDMTPYPGLIPFHRVLSYNMLQGEWSDIPMPSCVRHSYNGRSRSLSYSRLSFYPRYSLVPRHNIHCRDYPFEIRPYKYEWATSSFQPGLNPFVVV